MLGIVKVALLWPMTGCNTCASQNSSHAASKLGGSCEEVIPIDVKHAMPEDVFVVPVLHIMLDFLLPEFDGGS